MKKIGIISELNLLNVNYGNRLQAYALNNYLNRNLKDFLTESIILDNRKIIKATSSSLIRRILSYLYISLLQLKKNRNSVDERLEKRLKLCNEFTLKKICIANKYSGIIRKNYGKYEVMIVGSDVVWSQSSNFVNRVKFLNFKTKDFCKKLSYAASFGRDYIPQNNVKYIKKYLSYFSRISVREKSSIKLLNNIGVNNVEHVCDPTLLLTKEEWMKLEKNPNLTKEKYIFVYLLGKGACQRDYIEKIAKEKKLKIINIPNANGKYDTIDDIFGDIRFNDCSPENWLWLIHNAEYVFTDSFHGIVFSTIFEKKFIALKRDMKIDKNNRIIDYLNTINQEDKYISVGNNNIDIDSLKWNYKDINSNLASFIEKSKKYLNDLLND